MIWALIVALILLVILFLIFAYKVWLGSDDLAIKKKVVSGVIIVFIILICFTIWMIFLSFAGAFKHGFPFVSIGSNVGSENRVEISKGFPFN